MFLKKNAEKRQNAGPMGPPTCDGGGGYVPPMPPPLAAPLGGSVLRKISVTRPHSQKAFRTLIPSTLTLLYPPTSDALSPAPIKAPSQRLSRPAGLVYSLFSSSLRRRFWQNWATTHNTLKLFGSHHFWQVKILIHLRRARNLAPP